jgi:hypothetical protein
MDGSVFVYLDDSEIWLQDVLENHYEEALKRVSTLLERTSPDGNGCWVTSTQGRAKVRFRGRQVAAARFVYCVLNRRVIGEATLVRHRCHNERCCNPEHLVEGSAADNKRDDWENWSNGVDFDLL